MLLPTIIEVKLHFDRFRQICYQSVQY